MNSDGDQEYVPVESGMTFSSCLCPATANCGKDSLSSNPMLPFPLAHLYLISDMEYPSTIPNGGSSFHARIRFEDGEQIKSV